MEDSLALQPDRRLMSKRDHIHFVTGRLAEHALRDIVKELAAKVGFAYSIDVLPITVAALMTPKWVARHIQVPSETTRIVLPGYCNGDLAPLKQLSDRPIDLGPHDLRELPTLFGHQSETRKDYGKYSIEILAEINHAPRLSLSEIEKHARQLAADGADLIDIGCEPSHTWQNVGDAVRLLKDLGLRVSIDSFNVVEIEAAVEAGAELVLSVNSSNREAACDWGCEVVVIPDDIETQAGLAETTELLTEHQVPVRLDPILEPIGCGFTNSLQRYWKVREQYPDLPMMMGIGNITELTDTDSLGINLLLLAICEELKIHSVLTTQVINWARSSVRECALARQLVYHAHTHRVIPKHTAPELVVLRDPRLLPMGAESLERLSEQIKDPNYRLFAEDGRLHIINSEVHISGTNPYELFAKLMATEPRNVDPSHAFYLGYELSKAVTALTLGKQYRQDEALNWGFLTIPEKTHRNQKPTD